MDQTFGILPSIALTYPSLSSPPGSLGRNYSAKKGAEQEKWERKRGAGGRVESFGARNLAQLENEWHFNPGGRGGGLRARGQGGGDISWCTVLHCETIQRKRDKEEGTEIQECRNGPGGKRVERKREGEREGKHECRVSVQIRHGARPALPRRPFSHTLSFGPRRVGARARGTEWRAALELHCIIHTRDIGVTSNPCVPGCDTPRKRVVATPGTRHRDAVWPRQTPRDRHSMES